jgi:hypothetical protein
MDKQNIKDRQVEIHCLIKKFVFFKLNDEYAHVAERMLWKLAHKNCSPILDGNCEEWAAAIVHALGTINFLFDKKSDPYTAVEDIHVYFRTDGKSTFEKSRQIIEILNVNSWTDEFSIASLRHSVAFNRLVMLNGCFVPKDSVPKEYH